jgi:hypothetical protein
LIDAAARASSGAALDGPEAQLGGLTGRHRRSLWAVGWFLVDRARQHRRRKAPLDELSDGARRIAGELCREAAATEPGQGKGGQRGDPDTVVL